MRTLKLIGALIMMALPGYILWQNMIYRNGNASETSK